MVEIPEIERQKILAIAREVRRHVRKETGTYCPPIGLCGEASIAISARLTRAGIPHEIWGGTWLGPVAESRGSELASAVLEHDPDAYDASAMYQHSWVQFPQYGGAILDVTADQYSDRINAILFPAREDWYQPDQKFDLGDIFETARAVQAEGKLGKPLISLAGPRFRRPEVRVRPWVAAGVLSRRAVHVREYRRRA